MSVFSRQLMVETPSQVDLHQLLVPSPYDASNTPPKHTPTSACQSESNTGSYFAPDDLSRTTSAFSFSRASFSSQLASLTSMTLPKGTSLAAGIASLPTAPRAIKGLSQAAEQIQAWTIKALGVLKSLDADDDVEWAAAAGRESLDEVDQCVSDLEHLISVYVQSIEELQFRDDIGDVRSDQLQNVVGQMEVTLDGWDSVRSELKGIHDQVELAMEFRELWGSVLGDVGVELEGLSGLVFEMEEKRHTALHNPSHVTSQNVDLYELEHALGNPSEVRRTPNSRFSLPPAFESSPLGSPVIENPQDDTELLGLFARMQPLRASLDFLPMRTSMFHSRAHGVFPNACKELEEKRERLEKNWTQLSKDAENLRRELSEDRWVIVFRNAGRQARKMCESVERSIAKVQEALDNGYQRTNAAALARRIESFEAKKTHYGPAVQRVLAIIQKGLKDRLTINGEILRLHKDMSTRAREMLEGIEDMGHLIDHMNANHNSQLRESISSIVSADRSLTNTTYVDTPVSSPASSVDLPAQRQDHQRPKYGLNGYSRLRVTSTSRPQLASSTRTPSRASHSKRTPTQLSLHSAAGLNKSAMSPSAAVTSVYKQGVYMPPTAPVQRPSLTPLVNRPRWSSTINVGSAATTPSSYRQARSVSTASSIPHPSPLSREASSPSPALPSTMNARRDNRRLRSFAERVASPSQARRGGLMGPVPYRPGRNVTTPLPGPNRSQSSMAVPNNTNQTTSSGLISQRASSSLSRSRSYVTRQPYQPISTEIDAPNAASFRKRTSGRESKDSAVDLNADHEQEQNENLEMNDSSEPDFGSSPLAKMMSPRSPSSAKSGKRRTRPSLLPLLVSGRVSSKGFR